MNTIVSLLEVVILQCVVTIVSHLNMKTLTLSPHITKMICHLSKSPSLCAQKGSCTTALLRQPMPGSVTLALLQSLEGRL